MPVASQPSARAQIVHPLSNGVPPAWAGRWGQDRFGPFADLVVEDLVIDESDGRQRGGGFVSQRLRWIPPGTFEMGSPADEPGRFEDEGPVHRVTLTEGFWMFDTPCTQALWQAVLGDNPSHFKDPQRPVESVAWTDLGPFFDGLRERIRCLQLTLPTEAQWEYACRAGPPNRAIYTGPIEILGDCNAPALDPIAWYSGNSGVDFDLPEMGYNSRAWPQKQYPHEQAGTRRVKQKLPNVWGLYDMLGNVWEWCRDGKRDYKSHAEENPVGPARGAAAPRVLRGGSWDDYARDVRSASRGGNDPGNRVDLLGFRCIAVQEST